MSSRKRQKTRPSCPQTIVLMDVLFIFLIVLLIKSLDQKRIDIDPPRSGLFSCGEIVRIGDSGQPIEWMRERKKWVPISEISKKYAQTSAIYADCENACLELGTPIHETELKLLVMGDLFDQIGRLVLLACHADLNGCSSMRIPVTEMGRIDIERTVELNPILRASSGIENLILENHNDEACPDSVHGGLTAGMR